MQTIPLQTAIERFDELPPKLQEAATSITTGRLVFAIGRAHNLDNDKIGDILTIVAAVLFGFIHVEELGKRIKEELNIHPELAKTLAEEIDLRILSGLRPLLYEIYKPVIPQTEGGAPALPIEKIPVQKNISLENLGATETAPEPISIKPSFTPPQEGTPLIIHEEKNLTEEKKPSFRGFSFPGFFRPKKTGGETPTPVKVKIETPGEEPAAAKAKAGKEKRVVHYSEFRTPLSPFNENGKFINLEGFSKMETPAQEIPPPPIMPQPTTQPAPTRLTPENQKIENKILLPQEPPLADKIENPSRKFFWFSKNNKKTPAETKSAPPPPTAKPKPLQKEPLSVKPQPEISKSEKDAKNFFWFLSAKSGSASGGKNNKPQAAKPEESPKPQNNPPETKKENDAKNQPTIEGNLVDLRRE